MGAELAKVNFLIVDDIDENLTALEALLRRDDLDIKKARSGTEALELLLAHEFALALIDVQMPGMDGFELAELMRGAERSKRVPIIFVTAGARETRRVFKGYEAGAVDFLFKPVEPHILRQKADIFFELYRQRQQLDAQIALLEKSEAFRRGIIESSPDCINVLDADTHLLWINEWGRRIMGGADGAPLAGRRWLDFWSGADRVLALAAVAQAKEGGVGRFEGYSPMLGDDAKWWEVVLTALVAGSHAQDLLCVSRDITDRKRAETERERLLHELERSNRELEQFAYVAAHDLKTPLRGIASVTQWIGDDLGDRVTDDLQQQMSLLLGRVRRMEALIDGILSYSRAGKTKVVPEQVDVSKLLAESISLIAPPAAVTIEVAGEMPILWAARVPLQQLFMNLINNALKHAGRTDVAVRVSARDADPYWEFSVADNGIGIEPKYHERIWGLFQTLESKDKTEGTGIGLSVVRKVVESRGGRTWVESSSGAGATFYFLWPKTEPPKKDNR